MSSRWAVVFLVLAVWLSLLLVRCRGGVPPEQLVQDRCTRCHTLAPIEVARKTPEEWTRTVYRMIDKGARLSDAEAERVIAYLSDTHGADGP